MSRLYKQQVVTQVNSWDIFDTLLFRVCKDPIQIFNEVEKKFPSFSERRILCEKKNGLSFDTIYEAMKITYGYSDAEITQMKHEEFKAELNNIYPIMSMIEQVKSEDILVSDMYYSESIIRLFFQNCGIKLNNKIFVSTGGKSTGTIWTTIKNMGYSIRKHTGDNPQSDGIIAERFGIPSKIVNISEYSAIEKMIEQNIDKKLANIMRYTRLRCPVPKSSNEAMWYHIQSQFNIPILVAYANIIHKKFKGQKLYFVARDSYYLFKIYKLLFPEDECEYIVCSRMSLYYPNSQFINYIKTLDKSAIWIDLHGTGLSFNSFFSKYIGDIPRLFFCIGVHSHSLTNVESVMISHDYIEVMNEPIDNSLIFYGNPSKFIEEEKSEHRGYTEYCMNNLFQVLKTNKVYIESEVSTDIIKNLYSSINQSQVPYKSKHTVYHYTNGLRTLENKSPKTHLLLFHTEGKDGTLNLTEESNFLADSLGKQFDFVLQMTPSNSKHFGTDFDSFFKSYPEYKNKKEHNRTNDIGFCAWKPWIISRYLEKVQFGDIVLYHDTNCSRHPYYAQNQIHMKGFLQFLLELSGEDIAIDWDNPEINKSLQFVKQEIIEDICSGSLEFSTEYPLLSSNRILIRKSEKSVGMIKEWETYSKKRKYIVPDFPPQMSGFKHHKHDQSILTAIIAKHIRKGNLKKNFPGYYFQGKIFNFDSVRTFNWKYEEIPIETHIETLIDVSNNILDKTLKETPKETPKDISTDISLNYVI
jgi:hypothetical protein